MEFYQCQYCLRVFKNKNAIVRHRKIKLLCREKTKKCIDCGKFYLTDKSLMCHQKIYCKPEKCLINEFITHWLVRLKDVDNVPKELLFEIDMHNASNFLTLVKALRVEMDTSPRNKKTVIRIILKLFQNGFLSETNACNFICQIN